MLTSRRGFQRNTLTNREGGTDPEQFRVEAVIDRTNTLGTVWLGLTVGCAQCHDHKYDPITQRDYYRLFAFFNTAEEWTIDAPLGGRDWPALLRSPHIRSAPQGTARSIWDSRSAGRVGKADDRSRSQSRQMGRLGSCFRRSADFIERRREDSAHPACPA